jgi:hypothetical protein
MDARRPDEYYGARVAPVAQLDRVLPSEGRGHGFESRQVHHQIQGLQPLAHASKYTPDSGSTAADVKNLALNCLRGFFSSAIRWARFRIN